jgi:hypothetical protein
MISTGDTAFILGCAMFVAALGSISQPHRHFAGTPCLLGRRLSSVYQSARSGVRANGLKG